MNTNDERILLSDVEETGLLTLYCKAIESQSENPIIHDEKSVEMAQKLDPILEKSNSKLLKRLVARDLDPRAVVHIALRALRYDQYALEFLKKNPGAVIVNIGCGMDSRFFRIDNGKLRFLDVDLPEIINFKKKLMGENERYQMIAGSVFDYQWMDAVKKTGIQDVMFIAEGVFMYLDPDKVKQLVLDLRARFPGSELVCEVVKKQWTQGMWGKMTSAKMSNRLSMGENAGFHFGLDHSREMEAWHPGIQYQDKWSYFETNHEKLGWMRMFKDWKYFREAQYTVHYKLN